MGRDQGGGAEGAGTNEKTVLSGVPRTVPSLLRAYELSTRAATVGFDWVKAEEVLDKIDEEVAEIRAAVAEKGAAAPEVEEEVGDLALCDSQPRAQDGDRAGSGAASGERQVSAAV